CSATTTTSPSATSACCSARSPSPASPPPSTAPAGGPSDEVRAGTGERGGPAMTTAFVLSGGGSLGAVQVGMLQALADRDLRPDLLVGTSAGALNAAFVAGHGFDHRTLDRLAGVWRRLRRRDVFPFAPHRQLLALAGARPSLCRADGLRRLVE